MTRSKLVEVRCVDGTRLRVCPAEKHPAVFSDDILAVLDDELRYEFGSDRVDPVKLLDPFAGTGKISKLSFAPLEVTGVELEPEWAARNPDVVVVGDATVLPLWWQKRFDAAATSPCYGNRFADAHTPGDACNHTTKRGDLLIVHERAACPKCKGSGLSPRRSYTHDIGHKLADNNAGAMHYGPAYRELNRAAWREMFRCLKPGAPAYVNVKDHVRDKKRVRVSAWHLRELQLAGFVHEWTIRIPLDGLRYGQNHAARVTHEIVYVMRKP